MTPTPMIVWGVLAGTALLTLVQAALWAHFLRKRGRTRLASASTDEYRLRFLGTPLPVTKRRVLYVSEAIYVRYLRAAQCVLPPESSLLHLTDAILRDRMDRYEVPIAALHEQRKTSVR